MKKLLLSLMFVAFVLSANASLKQNRLDARFMTDRMAYELNFSADQFQDVYEVNLDFIYKVSFIIDNIVNLVVNTQKSWLRPAFLVFFNSSLINSENFQLFWKF